MFNFLDKLNFLDCLHFLKSYVLHSQNSYLSPFPIKSYTNHPLYSLHAEGLTRTERNKNLSILMRIFKLSTCQSFLHKIVQIFIAEFVLFCRFLGHGVLLSDRLLGVDYGHRFKGRFAKGQCTRKLSTFTSSGVFVNDKAKNQNKNTT